MCAAVGVSARPPTAIPKQTEVAVGKMIVAEPNPLRSPLRQTGGDAPLYSLPPLRTANRGLACCAKALLAAASIPPIRQGGDRRRRAAAAHAQGQGRQGLLR